MIMIHNQAGTRMMPAWWGLKIEKCPTGYRIVTDKGHRHIAQYKSLQKAESILKECIYQVEQGRDYIMPKEW